MYGWYTYHLNPDDIPIDLLGNRIVKERNGLYRLLCLLDTYNRYIISAPIAQKQFFFRFCPFFTHQQFVFIKILQSFNNLNTSCQQS